MAASTYQHLIRVARKQIRAAKGNINDTTYAPDPFWDDDELLEYALNGTKDLWGAFVDLHQEHYLKIVEDGSVSMGANSTELSGVPPDTFRVYMIEPLDPTTNACAFIPRPYNHQEFINARQQSVQTSFSAVSGINIFYNLQGVGAPISAPVVKVAPKVAQAVTVRFVYVPVLNTQGLTAQSVVPVPGEADNAIIAWVVAYMRAKEREDRLPDPGWLQVYATEKQSLLTRSTPRQEQDAQYADGVHDSYWR